jgi:hypothetical protein
MKSLLLLGTLLFAACDHEISDPAQPDLSPRTADSGCGQVDFCIPYLGPVPDSFSQCVLPFEGSSDVAVARPYFDCVVKAGSTGACASQCATKPDAGLEKAGCSQCLKGTCANGTCTGGACSAEATACY